MRDGVRRFRAPGRVNLIGDHTDYDGGLVLPMAIDRTCAIVTRSARALRASSRDGRQPALERFLVATEAVLRAHGVAAPAVDLEVRSDVPIGAGLSSSAALSVGLVRALTADLDLDPATRARWARDAEEQATGVPCGLMDQLAAACGVAGHALLIDCRSLAVEPIELPAGLGVVIVHSGVTRRLDAGAYAERRSACAGLAQRLGLPALRAATLDQVAGEPLGRHVVTENARVRAAADALRDGDGDALGTLMLASHASLRDDARVSTPELDRLVDLLVDEGALGARLTGAGFGGCVVGVGRAREVVLVGERAAARYHSETGKPTFVLAPRAVDGASEVRGTS